MLIPSCPGEGGNSATAPQRTCPSVHPLPVPGTPPGDSPNARGERVAHTGPVYVGERAENV